MSLTLAEHLRALPDEELCTLVALRPDLVVPVPADISALAVRAQSRLSVARALDGLDRFVLQVLDAVRLTCGDDATSGRAVLAMTGGVDPVLVRRGRGPLRARGPGGGGGAGGRG